MDDFLHNLRSGKLKQHDRPNRSYGDQQYKGSQRRSTMDRRKKGNESLEQMAAIRELLESVSETQKRIAAAQEDRAESEERKARAMERIAESLSSLLRRDSAGVQAETEAEGEVEVQAEAKTEIEPNPQKHQAGKLTEESKQAVFDLIHTMRETGDSWEKIARSIASQGYPTISGKGSWRGVMAKNLYEKMSAN
jgi:hypothetical protein